MRESLCGEKRRVELKKELERLRSLEWGLQDRDKSHHRMCFDGANNPTPTWQAVTHVVKHRSPKVAERNATPRQVVSPALFGLVWYGIAMVWYGNALTYICLHHAIELQFNDKKQMSSRVWLACISQVSQVWWVILHGQLANHHLNLGKLSLVYCAYINFYSGKPSGSFTTLVCYHMGQISHGGYFFPKYCHFFWNFNSCLQALFTFF